MGDTTLDRRRFLEALGAAGGSAAVYAAATALGLAPKPAAAGPLDLKPGSGRRVAILGAGVAGLTAAYELGRAGYDCTVLEAAARPGGRNLTVRGGDVVDEIGARQVCAFDDRPDLYLNAGPARIPADHVQLLAYCRAFGVPLEIFVNENRNAWVQDDAAFDGRPVRARQYRADVRGFLAELLAKSVDPAALDVPLSADDAERLFELFTAYGDLAGDGRYRGSARAGYARGGVVSAGVVRGPAALLELLRTDHWREYMHWGEVAEQAAPMMQPVGGMDRIIDAFMARVGERVSLRSPVREIRLRGGGVDVVHGAPGGGARTLSADYCLNSIPMHLAARLDHNFPARYARALAAPPHGELFKIGFQMRRRFWEDERIYGGISWTNQDITQIWYPPHGIHGDKGIVVGAYAFEDTGARLTRLSTSERLDTAIRQAEKVHPDYRGFVENGVSVAWARMPYLEGCPVLWTDALRAAHFETLQRPAGRHYLVGDQVSHLPGWQEGAVASAHHAIRGIDARERAA